MDREVRTGGAARSGRALSEQVVNVEREEQQPAEVQQIGELVTALAARLALDPHATPQLVVFLWIVVARLVGEVAWLTRLADEDTHSTVSLGVIRGAENVLRNA